MGGVVVDGGSVGGLPPPHSVTFQDQSQTLFPELKNSPSGQLWVYRYPFEH